MRIYCAWFPLNGGKQCDSRMDKLSDFPSLAIVDIKRLNFTDFQFFFLILKCIFQGNNTWINLVLLVPEVFQLQLS